MIAGWTEGLQLMAEGGKATLTIPSELGYGTSGIHAARAPRILRPLTRHLNLIWLRAQARRPRSRGARR